jgi:signal transduction histidine kinase
MARAVAAELVCTDPGRNVEFEIADGIGAACDPTLMRTVLDNLIGNAWKFTARRETAHVAVTATTDTAGDLVVCVSDDGAGFDPESATRLFGPFQRLHSQQDFPGTGVGLATVQRIVNRHGGRVWAESRPDRGTSMRFSLPAAGAITS